MPFALSNAARPALPGPRASISSLRSLVSFSSLLRLAALALAVLLPAGCVFVTPSLFDGGPAPLQEVELEPARRWLTSEKILLVDISGVLRLGDDGLFADERGSVSHLKDVLERAEADEDIVAVLLRVNSPGGSVTASDLMYREIREFQRRAKKSRNRDVPIIAAMMDTAASGGYYVAMAADEVWAHPTSVTGSIGVIATLPQLSGLADKLGFRMRVIKSGDKKDLGSVWRDLSDEERAIFQGVIDEMFEQFVQVVVEGRPGLDAEAVRPLADGRVYTAEQARKAGLIDRVGYLDEALAAARERAGVEDAAVVAYRRGWTEDGANVYAHGAAPAPPETGGAPTLNLINIDAESPIRPDVARFHYLWLP